MSFENETQDFKIPHLRNEYQKVACSACRRSRSSSPDPPPIRAIRCAASLPPRRQHRHALPLPRLGRVLVERHEQRNLEQFMLAFDSNLAPIVGQQITLTNGNAGVAGRASIC